MNYSTATAGPTDHLAWRNVFRIMVWGLLITVPLSLACILWVDRPLAVWIHLHGLDTHLWMRSFLDVPIVLTPVAMIYAIVYVLRRSSRPASRGESEWFVVSLSLLVALEVKSVLKLAFGRTWPREVMNVGAPQSRAYDCIASHGFINDGIHTFNAFQGADKQYSAFPSGSTVALLAVVIPLMAMYPRWRLPLIVFSVISLLFFVMTNTHFVGDVVAGIYVGLICGYVPVAMLGDARRKAHAHG
ncbi:hypothetical protein FHW69_003513 [Luteibacter sp. Sphag1AF]|uniref:phosphatase PAP2 family protein n=1 Tax=Luteibacter sp. Sphag1AF TaxID=2587031 RepID=UPI00160C7D25|nr:phosphatase PAP2 family protein [Luteibacter sp. Sphag1AF]MBB3228868.1 hypothetical protein [Luteibacter sp. Sphag1AF]